MKSIAQAKDGMMTELEALKEARRQLLASAIGKGSATFKAHANAAKMVLDGLIERVETVQADPDQVQIMAEVALAEVGLVPVVYLTAKAVRHILDGHHHVTDLLELLTDREIAEALEKYASGEDFCVGLGELLQEACGQAADDLAAKHGYNLS